MALYVSGRLQLLDHEPQNELVLLPIERDQLEKEREQAAE
jgi:hypothetical protein